MDILAQYEKQNPEPEQMPHNMHDNQRESYGFITRLMMKISRGKIQDIRQVNMVLIGAAIIMMVITFVFLFGLPGSSSPTVPLLQSAHPDIIMK